MKERSAADRARVSRKRASVAPATSNDFSASSKSVAIILLPLVRAGASDHRLERVEFVIGEPLGHAEQGRGGRHCRAVEKGAHDMAERGLAGLVVRHGRRKDESLLARLARHESLVLK